MALVKSVEISGSLRSRVAAAGIGAGLVPEGLMVADVVNNADRMAAIVESALLEFCLGVEQMEARVQADAAGKAHVRAEVLDCLGAMKDGS